MDFTKIKQNFKNSIVNSDIYYGTVQLNDIFNQFDKSLIEIGNLKEFNVPKISTEIKECFERMDIAIAGIKNSLSDFENLGHHIKREVNNDKGIFCNKK
jgi:hypothetical protein